MKAVAPGEESNQTLVSWLTVIGMLTMFWSPVERQIDQCVHLLHKSSSKSRKPTRLGGKLDFVHRAQIPANIIGQQELEALIDSTKRTVQIRDVCVHGVLSAYDDEKMEIGKVKGTGDEHVIEVFTIDRARLNHSASALSGLSKQWGRLASALVEGAGNA